MFKKRAKKYNFKQSMQADYYGSEAVRTKYEYLFEGFLREAGLPYLINQVFCFECDKFFHTSIVIYQNNVIIVG